MALADVPRSAAGNKGRRLPVHIDIKTSVAEPRRHTYANVARRLGADKPASRYQEATFDVQSSANFHYRPLWDPNYEIHDTRRTKIEMQDWYAFLDPRQFYYGTYTIARSRLSEAEQKSIGFVQKRNLIENLDPDWAEKVKKYLLPLRHYEWGANMNNCHITDMGYGTALTQATMFACMDRLGIAQIISRIGLVFDGNTGETLEAAKQTWMEDPLWQGTRRMVEDSFVIEDWFETFVAQNFAMDGIVYPVVYEAFDRAGEKHGAGAVSILCEFMVEWFAESRKWIDSFLKTAVAESDANKVLLTGWAETWTLRAEQAFQPLAGYVLGDGAEAAMDAAKADLAARAKKIGL